ncbi:MAG: hypothetical protein GTN76_04560 [Candidatus Aenigmarchaeota archaeon]|nr:hypothetical protein [Candidatus Aenigmarchaeota archaeon]
MKMPRNSITTEMAKERILEKLNQVIEEGRKPVVKFKDLYKGNTSLSRIYFKAGHELDREKEDLKMTIKSGFHQIEQVA